MDHFDLLPYEMREIISPVMDDDEQIFVLADGLKTDGAEYHKNDVVVLSFISTYVFGIVQKIIQISGKPYVYCKQLEVVEFKVHFHAYQVKETDKYSLIQVKDLYDYHPLGLYQIGNLSLVPLKHGIYN